MESIIAALLGLGQQVMTYENMKSLQAPYNNIKNLKLQLSAELAKGQLSDDAVIEDIEDKLKIEADSILTLLATAGVSKT